MIITEKDFECSHIGITRLPGRRAYIIDLMVRVKGKCFTHQLSFLPKELRTIGKNQAKEMVVDALLVKLNKGER